MQFVSTQHFSFGDGHARRVLKIPLLLDPVYPFLGQLDSLTAWSCKIFIRLVGSSSDLLSFLFRDDSDKQLQIVEDGLLTLMNLRVAAYPSHCYNKTIKSLFGDYRNHNHAN
jgi:hypothetical protein